MQKHLSWQLISINIYLHNYFNIHVCPSLRRPSSSASSSVPSRPVPLPSFQFLQAYEKVSLIKVAWYVLRVKNIHSWSPPDPLGPWDEEKMSYIHYDIRREEAKLLILKLASVFHHPMSVPSSCVRQHTYDVPAKRVFPSSILLHKMALQQFWVRESEIICS